MFFLNKHQIISEIKKASLIFQNYTQGKDFGKRNELSLMRSCKAPKVYLWVIVGNLFQDLWIMLGCKSIEDIQLKKKLII